MAQAHWCNELELGAYFFKVRSNVGGAKPLADLYEALVGALFLDQGLTACKQFIAKCLFHLKSEAPLMSVWLAEDRTELEKDATPRDVLLPVRVCASSVITDTCSFLIAVSITAAL